MPTPVLLHKHAVTISNEEGYIQTSLARMCLFKKVWKATKMQDGNHYIGNIVQTHFFSETLLEFEPLPRPFLS